MWELEVNHVLAGGHEVHVSVWSFETRLTLDMFVEMAKANWDSWIIRKAA